MKNNDEARPPAKAMDTDGFASKRCNNVFRKLAHPHEKQVFGSPQIGKETEFIDSAGLLKDKD